MTRRAANATLAAFYGVPGVCYLLAGHWVLGAVGVIIGVLIILMGGTRRGA